MRYTGAGPSTAIPLSSSDEEFLHRSTCDKGSSRASPAGLLKGSAWDSDGGGGQMGSLPCTYFQDGRKHPGGIGREWETASCCHYCHCPRLSPVLTQ